MHRILYVDDDPIMREIVSAAVYRNRDMDVTFARNGTEAIALMEGSRFDLIVLDLVMPDRDGIDVFKMLRSREETRATAVAFVTARSREDEYRLMIEMGALAVLTKPLRPSDIQKNLAALLQHLP